jgi:hypothetical protein
MSLPICNPRQEFFRGDSLDDRTDHPRRLDQVGTWPHNSVKEAMKNLYPFTNNYPGVRHAGTPENAMRDMVALSVLLAGLMPHLTDELKADLMYRGA